MDISNAFLHRELTEQVCVSQPLEFINLDYPHHVYKLHKVIYGLKQVPRAWFSKLSTQLLELGFTPSISDSSLFIYHHNFITLYVLVYVDDIIITGLNVHAINRVLVTLCVSFPLKDLGPLRFFLSLEIHIWHNDLHLSQSKYICDLLKKTHMDAAIPIIVPMSASIKFSLFDGPDFDNPTLYRSTIGSP